MNHTEHPNVPREGQAGSGHGKQNSDRSGSKRILVLLVVGVLSGIVIAGAQTTTADTNKSTKAPAPVIVTGCVDDGGESGSYMLTNAVIRATPKARPTRAPNSGTVGIIYTLIGTELQSHVGHKVEVTGLMAPPLKNRTASNRNDKARATIAAMNGTLTATSLKMVSPTCP